MNMLLAIIISIILSTEIFGIDTVSNNDVRIIAAEPINIKNDITITEGFNSVINGKNIKINIFVFDDGTKMIQLRAVTEALGYNVTWDNKEKFASIYKDNIYYKIVPGSSFIYAQLRENPSTPTSDFSEENSEAIELMAEATLIKGSIYVPTDFFDVLNADIVANDEIVVIKDYDYIDIRHDMVAFNNIYLGMSADELKNILGEPLSVEDDITVFVGAKTLDVIRFNYDGLKLDIDDNFGLVGIDLSNLIESAKDLTMKNTNISLGSNISDIFTTFGEREGQMLSDPNNLFYNYVTDTTLNGVRNSVVFVTQSGVITQIYMSILIDASISLNTNDFVFGNIALGSSEKELIQLMGEPVAIENSTSSAVNSEIEARLLKYNGISFYINESIGIVEIIYNYNFSPTSRGIRIGDSVLDLFEKYGMIEISDLEYDKDGIRVYYDYRTLNKLSELNYGITFTVVDEIITEINAYTIIY